MPYGALGVFGFSTTLFEKRLDFSIQVPVRGADISKHRDRVQRGGVFPRAHTRVLR
jgi:hypothetical protein